MTRSLIALLALSTATASATVPEATGRSVPAPYTHLPPVQIDASCLGVPARPEPRPAPVYNSGAGYGALGSSGAGRGGGGALSQPAPAPTASPKAEVARRTRSSAASSADRDLAEDASAVGGLIATEEAEVSIATRQALPRMDREERKALVGDGAPVPYTPSPSGPRVDWGGTIHLSNDDAMSLASAQRVLWAVERGEALPLEHIRKHELLNYFTFDTTPPVGGELLGIGASGYREGDLMRLAVDVSVATPPRKPVDLTVLVDRSGSMSAEGRMSYTRRALEQATSRLRPGDRLDLVVFDHSVCSPIRDFVVGRDDPSLVAHQLAALQPRGSTDLDSGLRQAYQIARSHKGQRDAMGRVMVFTDAILNTGQINPDVVTEVGKAMDQQGIRLTGVGVGRDFRDDVLDKLTEKGRGAYVFLGSEQVVDRLFGAGFDGLIHTVAEDVRFAVHLPDSLGMKTFHGEESSRDPADVTPVNLESGSHQVFFSDLAIRDSQLSWNDRIVFDASWTDPDTGRRSGNSTSWTVGEVLAAPDRDARKAAALMAWSDLLIDRAMGGERCGATYGDFVQAVRQVPGDAELSWVAEITGRGCQAPAPVASWTAPAHLKVRIDADQPIGAVALDCPTGRWTDTLASGDQVASFDAAHGSCLVTLHGAVPMVARVDIPAQGTQVSCTVRGGRLACR